MTELEIMKLIAHYADACREVAKIEVVHSILRTEETRKQVEKCKELAQSQWCDIYTALKGKFNG